VQAAQVDISDFRFDEIGCKHKIHDVEIPAALRGSDLKVFGFKGTVDVSKEEAY
jgi:hypothetical protein